MAKQSSQTVRKSRGRPRDWYDKTAQNTIKSLSRAMSVLDYLSEHQGRTLSEIAEGTAQSAPTVYRTLVTFESHGMVEFDPAEQLWFIGVGSFVIGSRFLRRTNLVARSRPFLRRLMLETGETANLGIEKSGMVLFLSQVETHASIRAFFPPGTMSPMHASGIGKAILAHMDEGQQAWVMKECEREAFTEHTIIDESALWAEMRAIRERGYSVDAEEKNLGMRCIAAPIFDLNGEVIAGISVSGPTSRMDKEAHERIAHAVTEVATEITAALGGGLDTK